VTSPGAQQTLASTVAAYMQALGDQWQAEVDLAGLLQEDDLFAIGGRQRSGGAP
jgi:hypothetical protein